jgi:hypothetical protein
VLRVRTTRLFNEAKTTEYRDIYKEDLTCYNKEIRKITTSSWSRYGQEISR